MENEVTHTAQDSWVLWAQGSAHTTPFPSATRGRQARGREVAQQDQIPESFLRGPRLLPTSSHTPCTQVMGTTFSSWRACSLHTVCLWLLLPRLEMPLFPPPFPLPLLQPGKLLLILRGPASCLLLREAFPDPQPNRVSAVLLLDHKVPPSDRALGRGKTASLSALTIVPTNHFFLLLFILT